MKIYIVNGFPGSGKTTFENLVTEILGENRVSIFSTVDFIKEIAKQCGWNGEKDGKGRKFLSELKDLLTKWDDVPMKKTQEYIEKLSKELSNHDEDEVNHVVFIDCREPYEIARLEETFGAKSIFIKRYSAEQQVLSNHSDSDVVHHNYSITLRNNSTLDNLWKECVEFCRQEKLI